MLAWDLWFFGAKQRTQVTTIRLDWRPCWNFSLQARTAKWTGWVGLISVCLNLRFAMWIRNIIAWSSNVDEFWLAYIGDSVFELYVRSRYVWPAMRTSDLQNKVVGIVRGKHAWIAFTYLVSQTIPNDGSCDFGHFWNCQPNINRTYWRNSESNFHYPTRKLKFWCVDAMQLQDPKIVETPLRTKTPLHLNVCWGICISRTKTDVASYWIGWNQLLMKWTRGQYSTWISSYCIATTRRRHAMLTRCNHSWWMQQYSMRNVHLTGYLTCYLTYLLMGRTLFCTYSLSTKELPPFSSVAQKTQGFRNTGDSWRVGSNNLVWFWKGLHYVQVRST